MKRCPQCQFIYEDEQTTCDMDGAILAFDQKSAATDGPRSMTKSFAVPAVAGTGLAAVLCLAFYTSPLLVAKPDAGHPTPQQVLPANPDPAPTPMQTVIEQPSPSPTPEAATEPNLEEQAAKGNPTSDANHAKRKTSDSRLTIRRGLPPLPRVPALPRLPPAPVRKNSSVNSSQSITPPKKRSKVETLLKKTGRVITRPFKF